MPIFATMLGGLFSALFEWLATRLTLKVALATAFVASLAAAWLVVKAAVGALGIFAVHVLPAPLVLVFGLLLPSDTPTLLSAVWVADTILSQYAYWRMSAGILYQTLNP